MPNHGVGTRALHNPLSADKHQLGVAWQQTPINLTFARLQAVCPCLFVQTDRRFSGATVPGRPSHIRAADAQKYAEAKAALYKSHGIGPTSLKPELKAAEPQTALQSSPVKDEAAPADRHTTVEHTAIPAALLAFQQVDNTKQSSSTEPQVHTSKAGHVALDAFESENAGSGATSGILRLSLAPGAEAGEDGTVSVKLHLTGIEPVHQGQGEIGSSVATPSGTVSHSHEAVGAPVEEACAADDAADDAAELNSAICDLSLP